MSNKLVLSIITICLFFGKGWCTVIGDSGNNATFFRPHDEPTFRCDFESSNNCSFLLLDDGGGSWSNASEATYQGGRNVFLTRTTVGQAILTINELVLPKSTTMICLSFLFRISRSTPEISVVASDEQIFFRKGQHGRRAKWYRVAVPLDASSSGNLTIVGLVSGNNGSEVSIDELEIYDSPCLVDAPNGYDRFPITTPSAHRARRDTFETPPSYSVNTQPPSYWAGAVVPYEIGPGFDGAQVEVINKVVSMFNKSTCLKFVPRRPNEHPDYVRFTSAESGCRAEVGYRMGRTEINLGDECFEFTGIKHVSHETLHILGLYHEHQRTDRDSFIDVLSQNIVTGALINFEKVPRMDNRVLTTEYDYRSVLHYSSNEYVKKPGLKSLIAKSDAALTLGNLVGPTRVDLQKVVNLYCNGRMNNSAVEAVMMSTPYAEATTTMPMTSTLKNSLPVVPDVVSASRVNLWENGILPYEFDANLNDTYRRLIRSVMSQLMQGTCLKFRERKNERNYIKLALGEQCSSNMGMGGFGRQTIHLGPAQGACITFARVARFLMLTAGVPYEHRRFDRDEYVTILFQNLSPAAPREGFQKMEWTDPRILAVPYDFGSVMHWPNNYGSKDPRLDTIEAKDMPFIQLGNMDGPTPFDIEKLANLYCAPEALNEEQDATISTPPPATPVSPTTTKRHYGRSP